MVEANDFNDILGAGSYPEPPEQQEKHISGKIVLTFDIDSDIPSYWNVEDVKDDILENLDEYISINDYETLEFDF